MHTDVRFTMVRLLSRKEYHHVVPYAAGGPTRSRMSSCDAGATTRTRPSCTSVRCWSGRHQSLELSKPGPDRGREKHSARHLLASDRHSRFNHRCTHRGDERGGTSHDRHHAKRLVAQILLFDVSGDPMTSIGVQGPCDPSGRSRRARCDSLQNIGADFWNHAPSDSGHVRTIPLERPYRLRAPTLFVQTGDPCE